MSQNMFYRPPSSVFGGCTTRSTMLKPTHATSKPTNYTQSTEVTS